MSDWKPDPEFIEFLEDEAKVHGRMKTFKGEDIIDLMRQGEKRTEYLYERLYGNEKYQEMFKAWKKAKHK